jgi:GNAT superfamily N-acetyltransferase
MNLLVGTATWEEVLPIWRDYLWVGRLSAIEPTSAMQYLGGYDMLNMQSVPIFFSVRSSDKIIAVNSVVKCADGSARSRGLWVDPEHRKAGYARIVLECSILQAKDWQSTHLWTIPRQSAWPTYARVGFTQTSDWFDQGVEFGPNCYASRKVNV